MISVIIFGIFFMGAVLLLFTKEGRRILLIVIDQVDKWYQNYKSKKEKRAETALEGTKSD